MAGDRHAHLRGGRTSLELSLIISLVPRPYFFLLLSLFIHKQDIVRQQGKKWAYS